MNGPKISVVMSVYNSEKYLTEAIESILSQTFKDFEFIIIDDHSTDNSLKTIREYAKRDKRIVFLKSKKNIGPAKSRNKCLKIAKGEYIAILDSDDVAMPERLQTEYDYLETHPDIFLVGSGAINISENGDYVSTFKPLIDEAKLKEKISTKNAIYHPSVMFRKENTLFYREKFPYSQDYDFYLCLLSSKKRLINIPDKLIKYRLNPNAISFSKSAQQKLFAEKAKEFYHQRLKYGRDEYGSFNPDEILTINIKKTINKQLLEMEIKANFKLNKFVKVRKFCRTYFLYHGLFNKISIYYLFSFCSKGLVNFLRKLRFS